MNVDQLTEFVASHADDIVEFMDYRPSNSSPESVSEALVGWFGSPRWSNDGHCFRFLGMDGTGGLVLAWVKPGCTADEATLITFLGSEGGTGVIARSPADFAKALCHATWISERHAGRSSLDDSEDPETGDKDMQLEARLRYCAAVEDLLGPIPALADLTEDLDPASTAFDEWVWSKVDH